MSRLSLEHMLPTPIPEISQVRFFTNVWPELAESLPPCVAPHVTQDAAIVAIVDGEYIVCAIWCLAHQTAL